ncbi:MAG: isocitrate lyase/phosphoenolpyruvate mutase family protein [Rhizobiales bacterium]|nr:isocitrate lyase/phosphoenolpyruvate mutase family protein [Hyphomicrobiales bacterium]
MSSQKEQANHFRSLHVKGDPIILYNIWDAGSAKTVAKAGAKALATGSAPVAMANGFKDGEELPLDFAIENIKRIIKSVTLPVTMDIEGGYEETAREVKETMQKVLSAGVIGVNFEDQIVKANDLYSIAEQSDRIKGLLTACEEAGIPAFINARTDIFLKAPQDTHDKTMINEAIERANAYEQAGASGFFAPGLKDEALIEKLCSSVNLPVNIMGRASTLTKERISELGVARVSFGPEPFLKVQAALAELAKEHFS